MKKRGLLLALLLLTPWLAAAAPAADNATVTLQAPSMVVTGHSIAVTVNVSGLEHFNAANYSIGYDPSLLTVDAVHPGRIDGTEIPVTFNSQGGVLHVVNALNSSTVSGSGHLARVTFTCIGSGTTDLSIQGNLSAIENGEQIELPATWADTSLTSTSTVLTVEAPQSVSDTFTAALAIANVSSLDSFNLTLSYNQHKLGVQRYSNGSVNGTTIAVSGSDRTDDGALRLVGVTKGSKASGSGVLAHVTFVPKNTGTAVVNVTDPTFAAAGENGSAIPVYLEGASVVLQNTTDLPPVASIGWQPGDPVTGDTVIFSADGSTDADGWITNYTWSIDDTSAFGNETSHHFHSPGTYQVTLTVTDNDGLTDTTSKTVTIYNAPPNASFSFSPEQPVVGQDVSFTDTSSDDSGIVARQWTFGDGATSGETNPSHTYSDDGTYQVTLTVTDDDATDTYMDNITVTANTPPGAPSQPAGPSSGTTGTSYTFTTSASDPDGHAVKYRFDWDDATDTRWRSTSSASHIWSTAGTYSVRVKAKDAYGKESDWSPSLQVTIEKVSPPPPPEPQPPSADFSYSADGRTVSFTDESSNPDGSIATYTWSFGDGASSTQASPVHTYASDGTYTVTLSVTDSDGMTDDVSREVTVETPEPQRPDLTVTNISMTPPSPQDGGTVQITVTVANVGAADANQTLLNLYMDDAITGSITLPAIEADGQVDRTQEVNVTAGNHALKAMVDPDDTVKETNENNNQKTQSFSVAQDGRDDTGGAFPWLIGAVIIAVLGGGAAVFFMYRREMLP